MAEDVKWWSKSLIWNIIIYLSYWVWCVCVDSMKYIYIRYKIQKGYFVAGKNPIIPQTTF